MDNLSVLNIDVSPEVMDHLPKSLQLFIKIEQESQAKFDKIVEDIEAGIASYCISELPGYRALGLDASETPTALELHRGAFALPLHVRMTESDVDRVCDAVSVGLDRATRSETGKEAEDGA